MSDTHQSRYRHRRRHRRAVLSWSASDVALYNLAVGAAADPMDEAGLGYIHDSDPQGAALVRDRRTDIPRH